MDVIAALYIWEKEMQIQERPNTPNTPTTAAPNCSPEWMDGVKFPRREVIGDHRRWKIIVRFMSRVETFSLAFDMPIRLLKLKVNK